MDAANIVAQKTAEVLAAAQEAEDSPLNFLLTAADATVEKARQDEAERTASMEEKKTKKARRRRREEAERSATTEEKQKLRKDREEQLKRKKEERLASFRRHQLRCESLKTSAPTCATSASVVADGEKPRPQELPRTAPPSSSSSSSLQPSQGVNFLFDLNLPPPPLLTSESRS